MQLSGVGFIHVVWEPNKARLNSDPPFKCIADNVNTGDLEVDKSILENEAKQAKRYDYYRDIKSISLLYRTNLEDRSTKSYHFVHGVNPPSINEDCGIVANYKDEYDMLSGFWQYIYHNIVPTIGGWNLSHCSFPLIVGKALQYGIPVPGQFLPNPYRKYQDPAICELSSLYTQCSYFKARPLPDVNDIGSWWSLPTDNAYPPVSSLELASLSEEDMEKYGYAAITRALNVMADMLLRFKRCYMS